MAALVLTATAVIPASGAILETGNCLEAIATGKAVYFDSVSLTYGLYKANGGSAAIRNLRGICVAGGAIGQRVVVQTAGIITLGGAVLTQGRAYVGGGAVAGDIAPSADIVTGWFTSFIGLAIDTNNLQMNILNSNVAAS